MNIRKFIMATSLSALMFGAVVVLSPIANAQITPGFSPNASPTITPGTGTGGTGGGGATTPGTGGSGTTGGGTTGGTGTSGTGAGTTGGGTTGDALSPGLPYTGAGGSATTNWVMLLLSGAALVGGTAYFLRSQIGVR